MLFFKSNPVEIYSLLILTAALCSNLLVFACINTYELEQVCDRNPEMFFIQIYCYIWKVVLDFCFCLVWYHVQLAITVCFNDRPDDKPSHPDTRTPGYYS